jgi:two-component system chemotaxis sensor kinase CheA
MEDFEKELKIGFLQEASQLLQDTEQCFLTLEANPDDVALLDQIFRLAHNLKGSSKAVGFDAMGAFTHEFESLLLKIKHGEVERSTAAVNLLLRCNDHLRIMVDSLTQDLNAVIDSSALTEEVKQAQSGNFAAVAEPESEIHSLPMNLGDFAGDTNRLPADVSDQIAAAFPEDEIKEVPATAAPSKPSVLPFELSADVAIDPEDLMRIMAAETAKNLPAPPKAEAPKPAPAAAPKVGATDDSIRVSLDRLEKLLNFVGEMVILQSVLREQAALVDSQPLRKTVHQLGKVSKEIQDISMSLRMLPVKTTFQKMQRIVRDTAQVLSKKVNLSLAGEETELDKTVLEHLGDPLVHIIRNAVDHGIESTEKRRKAGKSETGNVSLSAYHQGGRLVIEVKDDGGGIDTKVLTQKAIEKGIVRPGQTLTEKEAIHLIFHPGFSTKAQVTEVSGRGVGMDVVKTNIEKLSGDIEISTVLGEGTTFKIFLPLTLAIIDGMVVKCSDERFILPLAHVHESLRPAPADMQFNTGFGEVLLLRGENLPLYRLNRLLGHKVDPKRDPYDGIAIVVRATGKAFAVFVDDIIGQSQIVIKSLGAELAHLKGFSGSAILGDGRPSLILEMPELIQKYTVSDPRIMTGTVSKTEKVNLEKKENAA